MRTHFADFDYFVTSPIQGLESLAFQQLPVPQVSPSPPTSSFSDLLFRCFGSAVYVYLGIEKLPVETALSKFFSELLPQKIEFGAEDLDDGGPYASREIFSTRDFETESSEVMHEIWSNFCVFLHNLVFDDSNFINLSFLNFDFG